MLSRGENQHTVTNSYFDSTTSGQTNAYGGGAAATGSTSEATFATMMGVNMGNGWANSGGSAFPYLTEFYPNGVNAISGTSTVTTGNTSINLAVNGAVVDSTLTYANGSYYFQQPTNTISTNSAVLLYVNSGATLGNVVTLGNASGVLTGENITSGRVQVGDSNTNTLSNALLSQAMGGLSSANILYSVASGNLTIGECNSCK